MNRKHAVPIIVLVLFFDMACGLVATPPATPTPIPATNTPVPTPTRVVDVLPTASVGQLMDEVFMTGGAAGGGFPEDFCVNPSMPQHYLPPAGTPLPLLKSIGRNFYNGEAIDFCVYGIPQDNIIHMQLYSPQGTLVSQVNIKIEMILPDYGNMVHVPDGDRNYGTIGTVFMANGISAMQFYLWWPVGLSAGKWKLAFDYGSGSYESEFEIPSRVGISITPEQVDPFDVTRMCSWYGGKHREVNQFKMGEIAYITGEGFEANTNLPVGIYYDTGKKDGLTSVLDFSHSMVVRTDEHGTFNEKVFIDESYQSGTYFPGANFPGMNEFGDPFGTAKTFADRNSCFAIPQ